MNNVELRMVKKKIASSRESASIHLRGASHYGRRSRGRRFPPIKFLETKSSASRPFTLEAEVQSPSPFFCLRGSTFLTKATDSRREFGSYKNGNPKYGREAVEFFH